MISLEEIARLIQGGQIKIAFTHADLDACQYHICGSEGPNHTTCAICKADIAYYDKSPNPTAQKICLKCAYENLPKDSFPA